MKKDAEILYKPVCAVLQEFNWVSAIINLTDMHDTMICFCKDPLKIKLINISWLAIKYNVQIDLIIVKMHSLI